MLNAFSYFFFKSERLDVAQFDAFCLDGKVIEKDERGIKVIMLSSGDYLKVFKLRGWMTSSQLFSNARSFIRNAKRLAALNIPTVHPFSLYHFQHSSDTAVMYKPLVGTTVRGLLDHHQLSTDKLKALAVFIALIHQKGIHFKSLHFGNIVLTPSGQYGLIDIADMRIYPWPLAINTRIRSLKRIHRYQEDMAQLGSTQWALLVQSYLEATRLSVQQKSLVTGALC